jgi:hypothetical protein
VEKLVYVLWGRRSDSVGLVDRLGAELLALDPLGLTIDVADADSDVPSPVPTPDGEDPHIAVVSLWLTAQDRRTPYEEVLVATGLRVAGYLVSGALYTDYGDNEWAAPREWVDGVRSPAVLTVCLIHRRPDLGAAEFLAHWHGVQSPVSAEIQPRARYVRNEVVRPLTDGAPEIDGIVEEAWPSATHITDPDLFFLGRGDPDTMNANISRMIDSVSAFMDLDRMRNVCMSEYLLRTPGETRVRRP